MSSVPEYENEVLDVDLSTVDPELKKQLLDVLMWGA